MKVQDIMTRGVKTCGQETNLAEAAAIMWANDCGTVPVVGEDGRVLGMITDRDICMAVATKQRLAADIKTGEVIAEEVYACAPDDNIRQALDLMRRKVVRRLAVIDREGSLEGVLSLNDVVLHSEEASDGKRVALSYSDVVNTLKAVCAHRGAAPAEQQSQKSAGV
jgi:CBS domain-containing protein